MSFDSPFADGASGTATDEAVGFLPLRHCDPSRKLLAAIIFSTGISLLTQPVWAFGACCAAAALVWAGGLPFGAVLRRLLPVNFFFVFLWLFLPLAAAQATAPDDLLMHFGPVGIRRSGLVLAGVITLKGNAVAAVLLALAGTSSMNANAHGLLRLGVPAKLVTLLLLTHANLAIMWREYGRLMTAARLRGFQPRTSLAAYRTHAWLFSMLLVRSWQRAARVGVAMRLRGFCGRFPLLDVREAKPQTRRIDNMLVSATIVLTISLYCADRVL